MLLSGKMFPLKLKVIVSKAVFMLVNLFECEMLCLTDNEMEILNTERALNLLFRKVTFSLQT